VVRFYILGQARIVTVTKEGEQAWAVQSKPLRLLAYLLLQGGGPCRREALQAEFWPDKPPRLAANNLRQALWHLRQHLPCEALMVCDDTVAWNPALPLWVDALAFEAKLATDDLEAAIELYAGPLLPEAYDEWAQLERERLHLRYLSALEARAHTFYEARRWEEALANANVLITADPFNESAVRLAMVSHWALGQREAARRCYDAYRRRITSELNVAPLPETLDLYRRILLGEPHPDQGDPFVNQEIAARTAHFSLLETLGAFHQGCEQAAVWADQAAGSTLAAALLWQGRFHLRMGALPAAHDALIRALAHADVSDLQIAVLVDLATVETGQGHYAAAEQHYAKASHICGDRRSPLYVRLLCSRGGLEGRLGHTDEAHRSLQEAVRLARLQGDPAHLAVAGGNLGILLIGLGDQAAAQVALREALEAARRADAHWLTAHLTGHLGVLAQDRAGKSHRAGTNHRCDLEEAARYYQRARDLADLIGDQRGAVLWTMNLGSVRYEQSQYPDAQELLTQGRALAAVQNSRSLVAGADILIGACLTALGQHEAGMAQIDQGLALAQEIGDQQRILLGYLHRGRALAGMSRLDDARSVLEEGLSKAESNRMHRMAQYLDTELENLSSC
jgi:DNA-binding SARP family transcriptional activator